MPRRRDRIAGGAAQPGTLELQAAELIDCATEVELNPVLQVEPAGAMALAMDRHVAPQVRQRSPPDVSGNSMLAKPVVDQRFEREKNVDVEIARQRLIGRQRRNGRGTVDLAHARMDRCRGAFDQPPGVGIAVRSCLLYT